MWKRVHAVDPTLAAVCGQSRDTFGGAADATDGAQDPDLVARADTSVRASIAHERQRLCGRRGRAAASRRESILVHAGEQRRQIVRVDVRAARYLRRCPADHLTVLTHRLAGAHRPQGKLVTARDSVDQFDRCVIQRDALARGEIAQRDGHVVARGNPVAGRQGRGTVHEAYYRRRKPVSDCPPGSHRWHYNPAAHGQKTRHQDCPPSRQGRCRAPVAFAADCRRSGAQAHDQRHRAARERFEEDRFTRHQRVAVRARGNAGAHQRDHQARRFHTGPAGARARVPALVPDRADLRQPERAVRHQLPGRRARRFAPRGLRARGASVRPPQRRIPDRHPPLHHAPEAGRRDDVAAGLGESHARGNAAQAGMSVYPRDRRRPSTIRRIW